MTSVVLASIVGAALFFVAGAVAAVLRRRPDSALGELRTDLASSRATNKLLEEDIDRHRRAAEARIAQLNDELAALRVAKPLGERATAQRAAESAAALERARGEATLATREAEKLNARVTDLERQLADRTRAARDVSTENEQLKGRLRDAEAIRVEYVRLRTAETDAQFLKAEVARLQGELRALHVEAIGGPRVARGSQPPRRPASSADWTIGDSLTTALERFADDGTRSLAVADAMGFPLANTGSDGHALAAYAAALYETAAKASQFLPVAAPRGVEMVDRQGTRVSVWTFDVDSDRLLLANLAVSPVDTKRVEGTLADLSTILEPTRASARVIRR
jgi:hypothetical protein